MAHGVMFFFRNETCLRLFSIISMVVCDTVNALNWVYPFESLNDNIRGTELVLFTGTGQQQSHKVAAKRIAGLRHIKQDNLEPRADKTSNKTK